MSLITVDYGEVSGGGGEITFSFMPYRYNANNGDALIIPTSAVKHFKSVISPNSAYAHYNGIVVGYSNTLPGSAIPTLTNTSQLNVADFDVDTSYTYLVAAITASASISERTYDITLTLN